MVEDRFWILVDESGRVSIDERATLGHLQVNWTEFRMVVVSVPADHERTLARLPTQSWWKRSMPIARG